MKKAFALVLVSALVMALTGCVVKVQKIDYPDTVITKVVTDYPDSRATVYAKGLDSKSKVTSLEFKVNDALMVTKEGTDASFSLIGSITNFVYLLIFLR